MTLDFVPAHVSRRQPAKRVFQRANPLVHRSSPGGMKKKRVCRFLRQIRLRVQNGGSSVLARTLGRSRPAIEPIEEAPK